MFSYYLLERSYHQVGVLALQDNLIELNKAMVMFASPFDEFFRSEGFWTVQIANNLTLGQCVFSLPNQQFCRAVLPIVLKRIRVVAPIFDYPGLCASFPTSFTAFWGVLFAPKLRHDLSTENELEDYRFNIARASVNYTNLDALRFVLFKKIILCDSAFQFLSSYSPAEFSQIISRLIELDRFNQGWTTGSFSPGKVTLGSNLRVSNESRSTNNNPKTSALRWFKLPDGTPRYFEPHIKMGNFRIHFYPDNSTHTLFVGYIGPHLAV